MTLAYAEAKNAAATGRNYRLTDSAGLHLYVTKAGAKPLQVQSSGPDDQTTERSGRRATAVQSCAVGALLTGSAATAVTGPSAKPAKSGKDRYLHGSAGDLFIHPAERLQYNRRLGA